MGIISTLLHGYPSIPALSLETSLAGVLLISPWICFSMNSKSFEENIKKDIVTTEILKYFEADFVSSTDKNNYSEPILANADWWVKAPVEKFLVLRGDYEVFRDDIETFSKTLGEAGLNIDAVNCARQVHMDCILDIMSGLEPGPMSFAVWDWLETVFN